MQRELTLVGTCCHNFVMDEKEEQCIAIKLCFKSVASEIVDMVQKPYKDTSRIHSNIF